MPYPCTKAGIFTREKAEIPWMCWEKPYILCTRIIAFGEGISRRPLENMPGLRGRAKEVSQWRPQSGSLSGTAPCVYLLLTHSSSWWGFWLCMKPVGPVEESAGSSTKQPHPKAAAGMRYSSVISPGPRATPGALRLWLRGSLVIINPRTFSSI